MAKRKLDAKLNVGEALRALDVDELRAFIGEMLERLDPEERSWRSKASRNGSFSPRRAWLPFFHWSQDNGAHPSLGEAVMFDETYIHYAENTTQMPRVILFCDVERPLKSRAMTAINRWFARNVMKASASQNVEGEQIGALNRLFGGFYQLRLRAKQLKAWSRSTYYVLKWALLGGLFYLVFII